MSKLSQAEFIALFFTSNGAKRNPSSLELIDNKTLKNNDNLNVTLQSGNYKGASVAWFLAAYREGLSFLRRRISHGFLEKIEVGAEPVGQEIKGQTLLWQLACTQEGLRILKKYPQLLLRGNLDSAPIEGEHKGKTVLLLLASSSEGLDILLNNNELLQKGDLNASPKKGPYQGINILWWLANRAYGMKILQQYPELLKKGDLAMAPAEGAFKNMSALWMLAGNPEGQQLLYQHPELLKNRNAHTLYASPISDLYAGKSVIWYLAFTSLGRKILKEQPELLVKDFLNFCPRTGEHAGKTILWLLVNSPEGIQILKNHPELLGSMVNAYPFNGPVSHTVLRLLVRSPVGIQILKEHSYLLDKEGINTSEAEEIYMLMAAHSSLEEPIKNLRSQRENNFSDFEALTDRSSGVEPEDDSVFLEEIINSNMDVEPEDVEEIYQLMVAQMFIEKPLECEQNQVENSSNEPRSLPEQPVKINSNTMDEMIISDINLEQTVSESLLEGNALGKRMHTPLVDTDGINDPGNKQTKFKESDTLSSSTAVKAPKDKRAYFSAKYFEAGQSLQEIRARKPTSRLSSFNQVHPFVSLQSCQSNERHAASSFFSYPITGSQSSITLYSHLKTEPSSSDTVTFIFAGRKGRAMLPDTKNLGVDQRIVMVLSRDEFQLLNQWQYPVPIEFLVIDSLLSKTHGHYENTGSIQARRLAAFLVSWHWQLKECLYLDDNIETFKFLNDGTSPAFSWRDASSILQKERLSRGAIISGLQTLTAKPFFAKQDYCYKIFSMDFSQIKTLLMMDEEDDVFVLGYPAAYALNCMEDYYFQMVIDFALDYQKHHNDFLSFRLLALMDDTLGGFERCNKDSGIAKKASSKIEAIIQIHEAAFSNTIQNPLHKMLMRQSLQHLKKNIQMSFERDRQRFEKTKKADYRDTLCHNMAVSSSPTFFSSINHTTRERDNQRGAVNRQKIYSKKHGPTLQSATVLNQWQGAPFAALIKLSELKSYLSEEPVQINTYPHQKDALRHVCSSQKKSGVIKMTTGSGKTRVEILLANLIIRKNPEGLVHIVVPTIQLLRQFYNDFCNALDLLGESAAIEKKNITPVGSEENSASKDLANHNDVFREKSSVVIFCARSYALFLQDAAKAEARKPLLTMLDEFHLYKSDANTLFKSELTTLGFSATPYDEADIIFEFSRLASHRAGITVPLIVDKLSYSLKQDKRLSTIVKLLKEHRHPGSGLPLFNHKGIIYVNSIDEADKLSQHINQWHGADLACAVHSKSGNSKFQIHAFKKKSQNESSILVAVDMLTTGYDDRALSWCLVAKNNTKNPTLIHQISGRVLRFNPAQRHKIGYVLADCDFKTEIFECHKDREAIARAHENYFKFNRELIYLELLNAIQSNLPFERFERLFTEDKLTHHSLSKHLQLLLKALLKNHDGIDWQKGLVQHDSCLFRLYYDKNKKRELNVIELFLYKAYGASIGKLEDGEYRLYTEANFKRLLQVIRDNNTNLFEHISSERFIESTQYYLFLLGVKKSSFEDILNEFIPIFLTGLSTPELAP